MSELFDKSAPVTLRAASLALTTSPVASSEMDVSTHSYVTLFASYEGTDGSGAAFIPEVQRQGSTAWIPAVSVLSPGTPGGGLVETELVAALYTIPTLATARCVHVPVYGATRFRVSALELGAPGTPGTCEVVAVASRLGA
jgi:hypothetical protein